jgi:hypothetical protein
VVGRSSFALERFDLPRHRSRVAQLFSLGVTSSFMKPDTSPWTIRQKCTADWEQMRGDDKRRFCEHCRRYVHNVSAMSREEREVFATPAGMQECIFYSQRPDGGVADLSFLARLRRWIPIFRLACWSALIGVLPMTLTGCMGVRCPRPGEIRPIPQPSSEQTTNQTSTVDSPR